MDPTPLPAPPGGEPAPAAAPRRDAAPARMPWSLSNKLLLLTLAFVMVAEVLTYIPSIASFRNVWLMEKIESAKLIALAAGADPQNGLPIALQTQMLDAIDVDSIALRTDGQRWLIAKGDMPKDIAVHHDLRWLRPLDSIVAAFQTLFSDGDRLILVSGPPPPGSDRFEIVVHEAGLRAAMIATSRNILILSLAISVISAGLVYVALRLQFVRPMQRLSASINAFSAAPEDAGTIIVPSGRRDEIGAAETRLAEMQTSLRELLAQRRHLADLGLAVSKINHDLRNILASAQLFSDRLTSADDPLVKRFAPKVVGAIDRAIEYTRSVLAYGRPTEQQPRRHLILAARMVADVADLIALPGHERVHWDNRIAPDLEIDADPEQIFRALTNLCRNALEAVSEGDDPAVIRRIWAEGERQGGVVTLRICDTGAGVPERARAGLFQPFHGSTRQGGTGLGLAIAAEIVRAHGGDIRLIDRPGAGAVFELAIPDRPVDLTARRSAQVAGA